MDQNCTLCVFFFLKKIFKSFITFAACPHLDDKHTVFGQVVGGFETLQRIEEEQVDGQDVPKRPIIIEQTIVYWNPLKRAQEIIDKSVWSHQLLIFITVLW